MILVPRLLVSTDYDIEYVNRISASETCLTRRLRPYAHEIPVPSVRRTSIMRARSFPKEFVDYCSQTGCNDIIMFTVNAGETIDDDFTPIDAYYVSIRARPAEADEWGLGRQV